MPCKRWRGHRTAPRSPPSTSPTWTAFEAFDVVVDVATLTERARYTGRRDPVSDVAFSPTAGASSPPGDRGPGSHLSSRCGRSPSRSAGAPSSFPTIADEDELSFDVTGHQVAVSVVDAPRSSTSTPASAPRRSKEAADCSVRTAGRSPSTGRPGTFRATLDLVDATGRRRPLLGAHDEHILHRAFSRDGDMLATAADDRTVRVGDATGRVVRARRPHRTGAVRRVQSGRHIALQHGPRPDDHHLGPRRSTDDRTHAAVDRRRCPPRPWLRRATSRRSSPSLSARPNSSPSTWPAAAPPRHSTPVMASPTSSCPAAEAP